MFAYWDVQMYKSFRGRSHRKTGVFLRETGNFLQRQESDDFCSAFGWLLHVCPPLVATLHPTAPVPRVRPAAAWCGRRKLSCISHPQSIYRVSTQYLLSIYPVSTARCSGLQCAETSQGGSSAAVLLDTGALTNIITQAGGTGRNYCPQI